MSRSIFTQMLTRFSVPTDEPVEFIPIAPQDQLGQIPTTPPPKTRWDLSPEQHERFEERTCIAHFDGGLPWHEAERLALEEVLAIDLEEYVRQLQHFLGARK